MQGGSLANHPNSQSISKMHVWESQRQRDQPGGTPGSPTAAAAGAAGGISEASLPPDFRRKYDAWQQLRERQQKGQQSHPSEEGGPHHLVPQQEGQVCTSDMFAIVDSRKNVSLIACMSICCRWRE